MPFTALGWKCFSLENTLAYYAGHIKMKHIYDKLPGIQTHCCNQRRYQSHFPDHHIVLMSMSSNFFYFVSDEQAR